MKLYISVLVLLFTFLCSICIAQTSQTPPVNDWKPSTLNQPGQEYP